MKDWSLLAMEGGCCIPKKTQDVAKNYENLIKLPNVVKDCICRSYPALWFLKIVDFDSSLSKDV